MNEITSVNNELVKNTAKLQQKKFRDESGLFLLEGDKPVREAFESGVEIKYVFVLKEKADSSQKSESVECIVNNVPQLMINTFNDRIVQIGANASIGYGYCKFIKIYEKKEEKQL